MSRGGAGGHLTRMFIQRTAAKMRLSTAYLRCPATLYYIARYKYQSIHSSSVQHSYITCTGDHSATKKCPAKPPCFQGRSFSHLFGSHQVEAAVNPTTLLRRHRSHAAASPRRRTVAEHSHVTVQICGATPAVLFPPSEQILRQKCRKKQL